MLCPWCDDNSKGRNACHTSTELKARFHQFQVKYPGGVYPCQWPHSKCRKGYITPGAAAAHYRTWHVEFGGKEPCEGVKALRLQYNVLYGLIEGNPPLYF